MSILLHALWRFAMVGVGFTLAVAFAVLTVVLGLGFLPTADAALAPDLAGDALVAARIMRGGLLLGPFFSTIAPAWLVAAGFAEVFGVRSLLAHVVGAVGLAVAGLLTALPLAGVGMIRPVVAGGLVAGLIFWLAAARDAGPGLVAAWRALSAEDPRPAQDPAARSDGNDGNR